ncbi:MAG: hypothetical protein R2788_12285 [Saprospiraceae bacterium]
MARTYYELDEDIALDSTLIDTFPHLSTTKPVCPKEIKQQCMNFLRFTKKLSAEVETYDKAKNRKTKIENHLQSVATKKWLLEKVDEL